MATTDSVPSNSLLAALMNEETYQPVPPPSLGDAGLNESLVDALISKILLAKGRATGRSLADHLCLPFGLIEPRLQALRSRTFLAHASAAAINDYVYILTEKGLQYAQSCTESCAYIGPAPVPLPEYVTSVEAQSVRVESPQREQLERALAGLSVDPRMFDKLGPAVNSGAGLFLYGEPGNGKTTLAERIALCFGQAIWLPYALIVDGQIIKLFDPACHRPINHNETEGAEGKRLRSQMGSNSPTHGYRGR